MDVSFILIALLAALAAVLFVALRSRSALLERREYEIAVLRRDANLTQNRVNAMEQCWLALADAAYDALMIVDAHRHVIAINRAARDIFGINQDARGKTVMVVTRQHELDAMVEKLLKGEDQLENQIAFSERSFRVRGMLSQTASGTVVVLALQDVTELLRLTRARRDMVANFSHDLRTPISSIRLLVETLTLNFGKNPERDLKLLGKIAGETDSLQHMTQELIDLSMIESGMAIMRMVTVTFAEILNTALTIMETQTEQKRLHILNEIPPDLYVLADPDQIRRVMANLIHNAVKFTPPDGQIRFTALNEGSMVRICIKDTGPGIPPHERSRVFERFYQVDTARTGGAGKSSTGTGLGLAIAKHIVEAHGGKIWAEAGIPSGASICFTLPLADNGKVAALPEAHAESSKN